MKSYIIQLTLLPAQAYPSPDPEYHVATWILILLLIGIGIIVYISKQNLKKKDAIDAEERKKNGEYWRAYMAEQKRKEEEYKQQQLAELEAKYGKADKTIILKECDLNQEIRAYSNRKVVCILGKDYDFSSIISCTLSDDSQIEKGKTTIQSTSATNTDNGSMLGRAIVGGVVAGGVGAVIGGSTAKNNTTTTSVVKSENDKIRHNYDVFISVKDIANPMIKINLADDTDKANEVVALMNAIIASNN